MLTASEPDAVLPALSEIELDAVRSEPSPLMVESTGHAPARPESASAQVQWIVTLPVYQRAALAGAAGAPDSVGAVLSMLILSTVALAVLPALSVAVPITFWSAPSVATVVEPGQDWMPDPPSEQVNLT